MRANWLGLIEVVGLPFDILDAAVATALRAMSASTRITRKQPTLGSVIYSLRELGGLDFGGIGLRKLSESATELETLPPARLSIRYKTSAEVAAVLAEHDRNMQIRIQDEQFLHLAMERDEAEGELYRRQAVFFDKFFEQLANDQSLKFARKKSTQETSVDTTSQTVPQPDTRGAPMTKPKPLHEKIHQAVLELKKDYADPPDEVVAARVGLNARGQPYTRETMNRERRKMRELGIDV